MGASSLSDSVADDCVAVEMSRTRMPQPRALRTILPRTRMSRTRAFRTNALQTGPSRTRYLQILPDPSRFHQIPPDSSRFFKIPQDSSRIFKILQDSCGSPERRSSVTSPQGTNDEGPVLGSLSGLPGTAHGTYQDIGGLGTQTSSRRDKNHDGRPSAVFGPWGAALAGPRGRQTTILDEKPVPRKVSKPRGADVAKKYDVGELRDPDFMSGTVAYTRISVGCRRGLRLSGSSEWPADITTPLRAGR